MACLTRGYRSPISASSWEAFAMVERGGPAGIPPASSSASRVVTTKYANGGSPIPIARWAEARLIIAEASLGAEAVTIINDLHSRAGIPPTFASTDNNVILGQVIEERRRELFLESHQLNDKIRFNAVAQSLGLTPAALNPNLPWTPATGQLYKNTLVPYGTNTCFPFPTMERQASRSGE
jgi:hypothetical protein